MPELEPVLISAIEHYSYCPRQCGLIHIESIFDENLLTLRGNQAHERVHKDATRTERGNKVLRGITIWSEQYGITGKADAVEISPEGKYLPVEYKVGRKTGHHHALYQACAQAFCLEEMFNTVIDEAAVYYVASRERETYPLLEATRIVTAEIILEIREMKAQGKLPPPVADRRCPKCSLNDACMPFAIRAAAQEAPDEIFQPLAEVELP